MNLLPQISESLRVKLEYERQELLASLHNPAFRDAVATVPREFFVPFDLVGKAYVDTAIPIGRRQTTSQITVLEDMVDALELQSDDKVLEVGAGCGYFLAVLSHLVREVHGTEIVPELAERAEQQLKSLGCSNAYVHKTTVGDIGFDTSAPYDKICVSSQIPRRCIDEGSNSIFLSLLSQLPEERGILVAPVALLYPDDVKRLPGMPLWRQRSLCAMLVARCKGEEIELTYLRDIDNPNIHSSYYFVPFITAES